MLKYMNSSADPCTDFHQYACGNWKNIHTTIPEHLPCLGTQEVLYEETLKIINNFLTRNDSLGIPDIIEQKIRGFFDSCKNTDEIKIRGIEPMLNILSNLGGMPALDPKWSSDKFDWLDLVINMKKLGHEILVGTSLEYNQTNTNETVLYFYTPVHVVLDSNETEMRIILSSLGVNSTILDETVEDIRNFEIHLGTRYQKNSYNTNKNETTYEIDWERYSQATYQWNNFNDEIKIFGSSENWFKNLPQILVKTDQKIVANYMFWLFINKTIDYLPIIDILPDRYKIERWQYCTRQFLTEMEDAAFSIYAQKYYDQNIKDDLITTFNRLKITYREILEHLPWMDNATRSFAIRKLNKNGILIGYNDPEWLFKNGLELEYGDLDIDRGKYFENSINLGKLYTRNHINKFHTNYPKGNGSVYNTLESDASLNYIKNRIEILIGILRSPFYERNATEFYKFGALGFLLGHEMTHVMDQNLENYDENGNKFDGFWTNFTKIEYNKQTECLTDKYNNYTFHGEQIDGTKTLAENVADIGAIKVGYLSYKNWLQENNKTDTIIPELNLTGSQAYFLSFAQLWCSEYKLKDVKFKLDIDAHSPGKIRILGTLSNSEEFSKEFNCPADSPMNSSTKCKIW